MKLSILHAPLLAVAASCAALSALEHPQHPSRAIVQGELQVDAPLENLALELRQAVTDLTTDTTDTTVDPAAAQDTTAAVATATPVAATDTDALTSTPVATTPSTTAAVAAVPATTSVLSTTAVSIPTTTAAGPGIATQGPAPTTPPAAAAPPASLLPNGGSISIITSYEETTLPGQATPTWVPVVLTITFASQGQLWPTPASGSIGLGTDTAGVGAAATNKAENQSGAIHGSIARGTTLVGAMVAGVCLVLAMI